MSVLGATLLQNIGQRTCESDDAGNPDKYADAVWNEGFIAPYVEEICQLIDGHLFLVAGYLWLWHCGNCQKIQPFLLDTLGWRGSQI